MSAPAPAPGGPWAIGPFERVPGLTVGADPTRTFRCPVTGRPVAWAAKDVFNPGAVVHDGRVHLLVRAEDREGRYSGVSRIGLAASASVIWWIHSSSWLCGRALSAGKLPTMPALHCAMTRSGPDTMKSGAPMTGRRRREKMSGRAKANSFWEGGQSNR